MQYTFTADMTGFDEDLTIDLVEITVQGGTYLCTHASHGMNASQDPQVCADIHIKDNPAILAALE